MDSLISQTRSCLPSRFALCSRGDVELIAHFAMTAAHIHEAERVLTTRSYACQPLSRYPESAIFNAGKNEDKSLALFPSFALGWTTAVHDVSVSLTLTAPSSGEPKSDDSLLM